MIQIIIEFNLVNICPKKMIMLIMVTIIITIFMVFLVGGEGSIKLTHILGTLDLLVELI